MALTGIAPRISVPYTYTPYSPKPKIISFTDYDSDPDDAIDTAMLLALEAAGECDIAAISVDSGNFDAVVALYGHLNYWGRTAIPVGKNTAATGNSTSPNNWVGTNATTYGVEGFTSSANFSNSVPTVLRQALVDAPDKSVAMIFQCTFSTYAALLQSEADGISPLTGSQLVAQKVRAGFVCAGRYPAGARNPDIGTSDGSTTNAAMVTAANYAFSNTPVPMIFLGRHVSLSINAGSVVAGLSVGNPLRTAFNGYFGSTSAANTRPSFSGPCILAAVRGFAGLMVAVDRGVCAVDETTGQTSWTSGAGNCIRVVKLPSNASLLSTINTLAATEPA